VSDPNPHLRPVTLVLDTSAVVAFGEQSVHVGEVLVQVHEDHAIAAIPVACLVEASRVVPHWDLLELLLHHDDTVLLAEDGSDWRQVAKALPFVGDYASAVCAQVAVGQGAALLTRVPGRYEHLEEEPGDFIVEIHPDPPGSV
jgi:hypothetical protein